MNSPLGIVGYTPRWHLRAGERLPVHVSSDVSPFFARLIRLRGPVEGAADWMRLGDEPQTPVLGPFTGVPFALNSGSYFAASCERVTDSPFTFGCVVSVTTPLPATIAELIFVAGSLRLECSDNVVRLVQTDGSGREWTSGPCARIAQQDWSDIALSVDVQEMKAEIWIAPCRRRPIASAMVSIELELPLGRLRSLMCGGHAAGAERPAGRFDGKIESPFIISGRVDVRVATARTRPDGLEAHWDFGALPYDDDAVIETTGRYGAGRLVNGPARAVTSSAWRGQSDDYRERPELFAAAHFHRDDLIDADWPVAFELDLPADLESGAYCLLLSAGVAITGEPETFCPLPVFIAPERGVVADIALVLPTFSYRAYTNNCFYDEADPNIFRLRAETISKPVCEYVGNAGLTSLYSRHPDGSGVHLASMLRPQATMRPDFVSMHLGMRHQFSADLAIVGWLEKNRLLYHVITDETLHEAGADVLERYPLVITGSHPEYCTSNVLDAYDGYLVRGGSLMYLGGNGFYWRVAVDTRRPHVLEVRRSEGVRTWSAPPGERRHQLDGQPGSIWRALGRPPNGLVGIGFAAMGFAGDGTYTKPDGLDESSLPENVRAAMRTIGDAPFGIAGLEFDSYDISRGSPAGAVVLGTSANAPELMAVIEDVESIQEAELTLQTRARADIVLFRGSGGGLCFSVGSIRWASGFLDEHDSDHVQLLTRAVVADVLQR